MTRARARRHATAALLVGAVLGGVMSAGIALLLYTGQGFLRAAGLLISSTVLAVGAGLWAGAPERSDPAPTRGRWLVCALAFIIGGAFVALWSARPGLRAAAAGGALAVLLVIALPAYVVGALLAGLHASDRGGRWGSGVAPAAAAGAAFGILLATTVLIQQLEPWGVYYGGAAIIAFAALLDQRRTATGFRAGAPDMTGHVALITGAGDRGQLGHAIARAFLEAGASIVISARTADIAGIAEELSALGEVSAEPADLSSDEDVLRLVEHVRERHGRLDSLINVAGGLSVTGAVQDTDPDAWTREFERNAVTALRMCRAALPLLRAAQGAIVNFASPAGERAVARLGAYSAAKAGVIALTRALAIEERDSGVRVNAIAPGMIDTQQNRTELGADAAFVPRDDVAAVALFLASPAARGVNGDTVHVPGQTIR
jgi:NAD(P)-dependent dehydrogenase (short-subunit alcohol dehydrogenase family)